MLKGNCLIGQSGGPTTVINASLAGIIKQAKKYDNIDTIYGAIYGVEGVIKNNLLNLSEHFAEDSQLDLLVHTPASYLSSCRYRLPAEPDEQYEKIFDTFKKNNIAYFFYIGGNDSMDTVNKLSEYAKSIDFPIQIIGVPKTIDNDLAITDHTPGFGSAAKYVATTIREIVRDTKVYDKTTVTIVEIMGRNAGWLTGAAALARRSDETAPHLIYLPEVVFSVDKFLEDLEKACVRHKNVVVVASEGIKTANGRYVCEGALLSEDDSFGHKQLTGTARALADLVVKNMKAKIRAIELSLMQRCAAHVASLTDIREAEAVGKAAVEAAERGETAKMMYFDRVSDNPYKIEIKALDVGRVANIEKPVPREWIGAEGNDVTQELIDYILPLIQGEVTIPFKDGLPVFINR